MTKLFLILFLANQIPTSISESTSLADFESKTRETAGKSSSDLAVYFGQKAPGTVPKVFAPGIISKSEEYEFGSVFSKNADEFFYGVDRGGRAEILYSKFKNGVWSSPEVILSHERYGYNDPMLSPDEKRLYFISDMPSKGKADKKDFDIWYVDRIKGGWGNPINIGSPINSEDNEYYISFANNDTMYFSSNLQAKPSETFNFDIYKSEFINNDFQTPIKLPKSINTEEYEADVFIAPDDSYLIFSALRKDGFGRGDLYISFKGSNGNWSISKNMGDVINNEQHQLCPFVTRDNKYLFFTSDKDIYWVNARIIELYRENEK